MSGIMGGAESREEVPTPWDNVCYWRLLQIPQQGQRNTQRVMPLVTSAVCLHAKDSGRFGRLERQRAVSALTMSGSPALTQEVAEGAVGQMQRPQYFSFDTCLGAVSREAWITPLCRVTAALPVSTQQRLVHYVDHHLHVWRTADPPKDSLWSALVGHWQSADYHIITLSLTTRRCHVTGQRGAAVAAGCVTLTVPQTHAAGEIFDLLHPCYRAYSRGIWRHDMHALHVRLPVVPDGRLCAFAPAPQHVRVADDAQVQVHRVGLGPRARFCGIVLYTCVLLRAVAAAGLPVKAEGADVAGDHAGIDDKVEEKGVGIGGVAPLEDSLVGKVAAASVGQGRAGVYNAEQLDHPGASVAPLGPVEE